MASPPVIRPLRKDDLKAVTFQIGLAVMEPLGTANNKAYFHPLTISIWVGLSCSMIQLLGWWPSTDGVVGKWGVLSPLPAFATIAVPILIFFEWFHRPEFELPMQKALRGEDMADLVAYYSRSPASGFYVLDYNGKSLGLIGLDANVPAQAGSKSKAKSTETALVRHFFIEEPYRGTGIEEDLLEYAVSRAFTSKTPPQRIQMLVNDLQPYRKTAAKAANFHPVTVWDNSKGPKEWKAGIYQWQNTWLEINKDEWKSSEEEDK